MEWIDVEDKLPEPETPVLAVVHGIDQPIVLARYWEICNPMIEGYFKDFLYWDNPEDDGNEYDVICWMPLPEMPRI